MSELVFEEKHEAGHGPGPELNDISGAAVVTASAPTTLTRPKGALEQMYDVPITLVFEVERMEINIRQLLELKQGSLLELPLSGLETLKILVDGTPIAMGDVTIEKQRYGVRINELLPLDGEERADSPQ